LYFAARNKTRVSALLYYFFILPLSFLPMPFLYAFSRFVLKPLVLVSGFRKGVVAKNLADSFPEKSALERKQIMSTFYLHLCDLVAESIKAFTISEKMARSKMVYENTEIFDDLYKKGKNVVMVGGHYGNWELLAVSIAQSIPHKPKALYTPLTDAFFDKKMKATRSKFGLEMLPIDEVKNIFAQPLQKPISVIFGADQSPRDPKKAYWMKFLHQETGVQFGAEKFAKDYNCAVVYGVINRLKRGYYQTSFSLICEDPETMAYGEITQQHTKRLEKKILEGPAFWLWTHRRWKHKRPAECQLHA
jgi:KDO2-lipid IV(A) lauroyltransferase